MKVYVIEEGCSYEGTGIVAIYADESAARLAAEYMVQHNTFRNYEVTALDPELVSDRLVAAWHDGSDILTISKFEVRQ